MPDSDRDYRPSVTPRTTTDLLLVDMARQWARVADALEDLAGTGALARPHEANRPDDDVPVKRPAKKRAPRKAAAKKRT